MASQVTFTGSLGAGVAVTSKVFSEVTRVDLDIARGVMFIYHSGGITDVELSNVATLTDTIASGNHTIVAST